MSDVATPDISAGPDTRLTTPVLQPRPEAIQELAGMRHRELLVLSDRLGRMSNKKWDRVFTGLALLFAGGVLGGGFGLIPFLAAEHTKVQSRAYVAAIVVAVAIAILCALASLAVKSEREDSCEAIKADLDKILGAYGDPTN